MHRPFLDRDPLGRSQELQLSGPFQVTPLTLGQGARGSDLFPRGVCVAMVLVNAEMIDQRAPGIRWQVVNAQINRSGSGGDIFIMIVPDQDLDFAIFPSGKCINVSLLAHS